MGQKIGNFLKTLFFAGTFYTFAASDQVVVKVIDASGKQVRTVGVGVPFEVQVIVSDTNVHNVQPKIETNPELRISAVGTSTNMTTINGKTTVKKIYTYRTYCNQEGEYIIGPAHVTIGGKDTASSSVTIQASLKVDNKARNQYEPAFLHFDIDKKNLYKGESATVTITCYYVDDQVQLDGIANPSFDGCYAQPLEGPVSGSEVKNGIVYRYLQWRTEIFPEKIGTITLPAIEAEILVHQKQSRDQVVDLFSMMNHMTGGRTSRKMLYSNALSIQVNPLPEYPETVQAVGNFVKLSSLLSAREALQGEGVVYTLELVGSGNFATLPHPSLNLPEGLSVYESNTNIHDLGSGLFKKDFEYIIQGVHPGDYTLDEQSVTFFDTKTKTYKKLSTHQSYTLTINAAPDTAVQKVADNDDKKDSVIDEKTSLSNKDFSIVHVTKWRERSIRIIPWKWFFVAVFLLMLFSLYKIYGFFFSKTLQTCSSYTDYYFAAKYAKESLEKAQKENDIQKIYDIFITYFSQRLYLSKELLHSNAIVKMLKERGMPEKTLDSWESFFMELYALKFSYNVSKQNETFYTLAYEWIIKLEKYV